MEFSTQASYFLLVVLILTIDDAINLQTVFVLSSLIRSFTLKNGLMMTIAP